MENSMRDRLENQAVCVQFKQWAYQTFSSVWCIHSVYPFDLACYTMEAPVFVPNKVQNSC